MNFNTNTLYLNQLEPIAELDGNNNLLSLFVYGSKGNVPEYIIKNGVPFKVITNQLGSVVKVINAYGGMVQQEIEYDSFGNILSDSNPTFQPFRLAGGLYDTDTKLIRFGARDYDSETGRWTSKDPIKFDGGRNFYVYGENDPVMFIDITGLEPVEGLATLNGSEFLQGPNGSQSDFEFGGPYSNDNISLKSAISSIVGGALVKSFIVGVMVGESLYATASIVYDMLNGMSFCEAGYNNRGWSGALGRELGSGIIYDLVQIGKWIGNDIATSLNSLYKPKDFWKRDYYKMKCWVK